MRQSQERQAASKVIKALMIFCVLIACPQKVLAWSSWSTLTDNYFEKSGSETQVVLVVDAQFHTCGWNNAGSINLSYLGEDAFRMLVAAALSAQASGKEIQFQVDGCWADRARVIGLKLSN